MPKHTTTLLERINYRSTGWTEVMKRNMELLNDTLLKARNLLDVDDTNPLQQGDVLRFNGYIQKWQNVPGRNYFPSTTTSTTVTTTTTTTVTTTTVTVTTTTGPPATTTTTSTTTTTTTETTTTTTV